MTIGLILGIFGAAVVAWGLFLKKEKAVQLSGQTGMSFYMDKPLDKEEMLKQPAVRDRLEQSTRAKIGFVLLAIGFLFQLVGTWVG